MFFNLKSASCIACPARVMCLNLLCTNPNPKTYVLKAILKWLIKNLSLTIYGLIYQ